MNRRDIVLESLRHRQPSCLPYFLELTDDTARRMAQYTNDAHYVEKAGNFLAQERNELFTERGNGQFTDMFGVLWDKGAQEGDFGIVADAPLKEAAFGDYTFPVPDERSIREKCERLVAQKDRFTMYIIGFSLFERAWTLRGMENLLCDMIEEPDFVTELLDRITQYNLAVVDIVSQYPIDCVFFGDDWGQQKGLIMGLPFWKKYLYPCLKKEYAYVKSKGMFVAQHSCGDCSEVLPILADIGMDIYNTFQPEIYDIEYWKKTLGDRVTFYGGISTQRLLPFAAPDELETEMERIIAILEKNGGYILAPTHAMPWDIPPENVERFLQVAQKHGRID